MLVAGFNVGDLNKNGKVDPGEVWLFTSAGVRSYAVVAGQYVNAATATAAAPDGSPVTAGDVSHHAAP